jgi:hypothetical protein
MLTAAVLAVTLGGPGSAAAGTVPTAGSASTAPIAVDLDGDGFGLDDCAPLDPSVHPTARDLPDLTFADVDCDGIDGTASAAVFVAPAGSDAAPGTRTSPMRTIGAAVAAAEAAGKDVYVASGHYLLAAPGGVPMADGVGVYGGYTPTSWSRTADGRTSIEGAPAVDAVGDQGVVLQQLELHGVPDSDGNSYGLRAVPDADIPSELVLEAVTVTAEAAGPAEHGADGRDGLTEAGLPGGAGGQGGCGDGVAGRLGEPAGHLGAAGATGSDAVPALQEAAAWARAVAAAGSAGAPGGGGAGGLGGAGATVLGALDLPLDLCGGAGGPGGPGGGGGSAGQGGRNGAGSFGAYLLDSSLVAVGSTLASGTGGAGGNGGTGGAGGVGGAGLPGAEGQCRTGLTMLCALKGLPGLDGPPGGPGGGGGAGVGGPSVAVYQAGVHSAYVSLHSVERAAAGGLGGLPGGGSVAAAAGQSADWLRTATAPAVSVLDLDHDGINDTVDVCPSTPRGAADRDADGCPEPPQTSVTGGPGENRFATSTDASFVLGSDEAGSTFTCSLDGAAGGPCASPRRLTGLGARTHTLSVWARDRAGDADPTAATTTWTVPRDDRALKRSSGWKQARGAGYYLKTYSSATRKGAALTTKVAGARRLALVASTGPGFGKVSVLLGAKKLRTVNLAASRLRKRQVLPVGTFPSAVSGKLRVVVATSGKPVRIEGLGVATR